MEQKYLCVPSGASAIVIGYNIGEDVEPLVFTMDVIIGIFNSTIQYWNHSSIQNLNPLRKMPNEMIRPLHRTDASGTKFAFSKSFAIFNSEFNQTFGFGTKILWPFKQSYTVTSNEQMVNKIKENKYSIGYFSLPVEEVMKRNVGIAKLINKNGKIAKPTKHAIISAINNSPSNQKSTFDEIEFGKFLNEEKLTLLHMPGDESWPLSLYTFYCFNFLQNDTKIAKEIIHFLEMSQSNLEKDFNLTFIPNPKILNEYIMEYVKRNLMCGEDYDLQCHFIKPDLTHLFIFIGVCIFACIGVCGTIIFIISCITRFNRLNRTYSLSTVIEESYRLSIKNDSTTIGIEELTLGEIIGKGSSSVVYKGNWLGATVAVKGFLIKDFEDEESEKVKDFLKEASLLRHPNIVNFFCVSVNLPHLYIITEFCEKGSLKDIIRNKKIKLSLSKAVKLLLDAAKGMHYLHSNDPPIIHRDFKSANLLVISIFGINRKVDENWNVKVADFGMSTTLDKTRNMTICGTGETCAPEVLSNSQYTEKADVFSFGIVMWEVLTREVLYKGMNFHQVSWAVVHEGLRPNVSEYNFPKELQDLMESCWHQNPDLRPNFGTVVEKLELFLKNLKKRNKKNKDQ